MNARQETAIPASQVRTPTTMVWLLSVCCAISVANVYYAQPLLDSIGAEFGIAQAGVGKVITAVQIGCALALLLVIPLGDLLDRKRLMITQLVLLTATLAGVALASGPVALYLGMLGAGMFGTAMTQGLIAYAASLASPEERGRVVGAVQSGVVVGLLMARVLAGVITDIGGWRAVYWVSASLAVSMLLVLWRTLPALPVLTTGMAYGQLLRSMLTLLGTERTLQVRGMIGFFLFAAFSTFWTALVLPLSAPPLSMSHGAMGAFGLVGVVGALAAARAGHWTDQGFGQLTTGLALGCLMLAWLPIALLHQSIFALIIGIVLLDLGGQAVHVVNQSLILTTRPEASSRMIGCYMLFYSAGSGLGAMASTWVYAQAGWSGVCLLGFTASALAMGFWLVTRFTTRSATVCHGTRQTRSMAAPADCNAPAE